MFASLSADETCQCIADDFFDLLDMKMQVVWFEDKFGTGPGVLVKYCSLAARKMQSSV